MMKRFRRWRRRRAALVLFPATVAMSMIMTAGIAGAAPAGSSSLDASKNRVGPGAKVKLSGRFEAQPETLAGDGTKVERRQVRIEFRPAGKNRWRFAKRTVTDRKGRYTEQVKVKRTGFYRAVSADGRTTGADRIRVQAKVKAKLKGRHTNIGDRVAIKGKVAPAIQRRPVVVRIGGDKLKTKTNRNGKFKVKWKADKTGDYKAKVKAKGDLVAAGDGTKTGKTTVYRPAQASYFGPGLYGNGTACGGRLTPSTRGVAHKTLPCGTKVRFRYKGRSVRVPVIDRGPYSGNREWDLTEATRNDLGFGGVGIVWSDK